MITQSHLSRWADVVSPYLKGVGVALDLGAGTGLFSAALREWGASEVVSVEPSGAMRSRAPASDAVRCVGGCAKAIPLQSHSVGFIWISTAFHHFSDAGRATHECRRVLVSGGYVAVRGFVPGHGSLPWLEQFPRWEKATARFPDLAATNAVFSSSGFVPIHQSLVREGAQT